MISKELQAQKRILEVMVVKFQKDAGNITFLGAEEFIRELDDKLSQLEEKFPREKEDIRMMDNELKKEIEPYISSLETYKRELGNRGATSSVIPMNLNKVYRDTVFGAEYQNKNINNIIKNNENSDEKNVNATSGDSSIIGRRGPVLYAVGTKPVDKPRITEENREQFFHHSKLNYEDLSALKQDRSSTPINFSNADLRGVGIGQIFRARFDGADLRGSDITSVNLRQNFVGGMIIDETTVMTSEQRQYLVRDDVKNFIDDRSTLTGTELRVKGARRESDSPNVSFSLGNTSQVSSNDLKK